MYVQQSFYSSGYAATPQLLADFVISIQFI